MGLIIKYAVRFPELPLVVSNDATVGDVIVDGDVWIEMLRGAAGTEFKAKFYDLPATLGEKIHEYLNGKKTGSIIIQLGYMDGKCPTVLEGVFDSVDAKVEGDRLVTTVQGLEAATYALRHATHQKPCGGPQSLEQSISSLIAEARIPAGKVARRPSLTPRDLGSTPRDRALRGETLMEVFTNLAEGLDAEMLVADGQLRIGKPILVDDYTPDAFLPGINLARFEPFTSTLPAAEGPNRLKKISSDKARGFRFQISGDPRLRPGQQVKTKLDSFGGDAREDFRVHSLVHSFSTSSGYACEGVALQCAADAAGQRRTDRIGMPSAASIVSSLARRMGDETRRQPVIEMGVVKAHTSGVERPAHRASVHYGQRFEGDELRPSTRVSVETDPSKILSDNPLVSPFAWHKCGLVVPVYQGMKAVLAHNLALNNDVLISGFTWSESPALEPPASRAGDWWLCLPVDALGSSSPTPGTKATNDLTGADGRRVISANGLRVRIGSPDLEPIGKRPTEGEPNEFSIEHSSGTRVVIKADGSLTIKAEKIKVEGDLTVAGTLTVT